MQEDGNVISERESARIVWTRLYFDFRCLRCRSSQTSSGRHFAGFTVAIKTPGICVNFALKNEIMLFGIISGIISELISRITWSFGLLGVFWENLPLHLCCIPERKQSLANAGSKILGLSTLVIEQGLKQRKGCSLIYFFNPV